MIYPWTIDKRYQWTLNLQLVGPLLKSFHDVIFVEFHFTKYCNRNTQFGCENQASNSEHRTLSIFHIATIFHVQFRSFPNKPKNENIFYFFLSPFFLTFQFKIGKMTGVRHKRMFWVWLFGLFSSIFHFVLQKSTRNTTNEQHFSMARRVKTINIV